MHRHSYSNSDTNTYINPDAYSDTFSVSDTYAEPNSNSESD
jgi:hypothetical protein